MNLHLKPVVVLCMALILAVQGYSRELQKLPSQGISHTDSRKYEASGNKIFEYPGYDSLNAEAWMEISKIYEDQGIYDSALIFINRAIETDPGNPDALGRRMFIYMILENYELCREDARQILSIMPEDLTAIYCLAISLMEDGDYDGSMGEIQKGIELAPELAAFYSLMSRVLTRKGSYTESGMFINRAIDLAPGEPGNYLIRAENVIISNTNPSAIFTTPWPPFFRSIKSNEIKALDKTVADRKSPYFHKSLEDKFYNDFRSMGLDQFFMLYYGQSLSEKYSPYADDSRETADSLRSMNNSGRFAEAAAHGTGWLENNIPAVSVYWITASAFLAAGNYPKAEEYFHKYEGFMASILATGDGRRPESAYIVIATSEEYALTEYLGLKVSGQFLSEQKGHYFDILTCLTASGEEKQVYFNIDKPFSSLGHSLK
jgi:tetratricopeptide (TPR) repeat protein